MDTPAVNSGTLGSALEGSTFDRNRSSLVISKSIFRAYDIRGDVNTELTPQVVTKIGRAIGSILQDASESTLIVGRDGRLSGPVLLEAFIQGVREAGVNVLNIGMVPTPLLYFALHHFKIASGVILTGSHNPPEYNGLKITLKGQAIYEEQIQAIYQRVIQAEKEEQAGRAGQTEKAEKEGGLKDKRGDLEEDSVILPYLQAVTKTVRVGRPLKVVIDCGNGVTGLIAPTLYSALGCEVISLFSEVDGHFPNHHPDPGQPKNMQALISAVKEHQADVGLAFDGDGDRLGVVDNRGKIIWPDRLVMLFARSILSETKSKTILSESDLNSETKQATKSETKHATTNATKPETKNTTENAAKKPVMIFDVKCSRHVRLEIENMGGEALMWKTGHSLIKSKMRETGAIFAGEMSGHLFFKDRWYGFDDGLYAGARLLEILSGGGTALSGDTSDAADTAPSLAEMCDTLKESYTTPELVLPINESEKFQFVENFIKIAELKGAVFSKLDGLRADFEDGFGLLRPSNTGPNLILRFEGDTEDAMKRIQSQFREFMLALKPDLSLPF